MMFEASAIPGLEGPYYQWRHDMHQHADEELQFWRLSFSPTYTPKPIIARLCGLFKNLSIESYVIYELYGAYDLMLRVWVPRRHTSNFMAPDGKPANTLEQVFANHLASHHIHRCSGFSVTGRVVDWKISRQFGKNGLQHLPSSTIRQLNELITTPGIQHNAELQKHIDAGLISETTPGHDTIKFFIMVTSPPPDPGLDAFPILRDRLTDMIEAARGVEHGMLYEGHGFGQLLLTGRVNLSEYYSIASELITKINSLDTIFGVRTYTHLASLPSYRAFREQLPVAHKTDAATPIESYLAQQEGQRLEFKGSLAVDVDRWVKGDGVIAESASLPLEVLQAIVGMLNSTGGSVVIGALERKRYSKAPSQERLADLPVCGDYVVCGIDIEYSLRADRDWDWYLRRLLQLVGSHIEGQPGALMNVEHTTYEGRSLCVIRVEEPTRGWYYLTSPPKNDALFYVRSGNRTERLDGKRADQYKETMGRPT